MGCNYGPYNYGDCGCGVTGPFDLYGIIAIPDDAPSVVQDCRPTGLVRYAHIFPDAKTLWNDDTFVPNTAGFNSEHFVDWVIPPDSPPTDPIEFYSEGTLVGHGGERVWSVEVRDGDRYAVLYDAEAQTEVVAVSLEGSPGGVNLATATIDFDTSAANSSTLVLKTTGGSLAIIDDGGTITTISTPIYGGGTIPTNLARDGDWYSIHGFALRHWPIGFGIRFIQEDGIDPECTVEFFYGEISISGSNLTIPSKSVFHSYSFTGGYLSLPAPFTTERTQWFRFDSFVYFDGSYGAVITYPTAGSTATWTLIASLVVNGGIAVSQETGVPFSGSTGAPSHVPEFVEACFGMMHAGWSGVIVASVSLFDSGDPPNSSTVYDPVSPYFTYQDPRWQLNAYDGASLDWQSNPVDAEPICRYSSDNWFYIAGGMPASGVFPNEVRTAIDPSDGSPASVATWLVKFDGSQSCPAGAMVTGEAESATHELFGSNNDCVKNSSLLPASLPGDADEFEGVVSQWAAP